jgi:hypothetical protein
VTKYDLQLATLWASGSIFVVLRHTEGGISSGLRGLAFLTAVALLTVGAAGIPLRRLRREQRAEDVAHGPSNHAWREFATRLALVATITVIPLAFINLAVAIVTLATGACAIAVALRWHVRKSRQRGLPDSERWLRRHVRLLELPVPLDGALAAIEEELRADPDVRVERPTGDEIVAEKQGSGVSGYRITVTGAESGSSASNLTLVAQPLAGMFDGGRSWEALMSLKRRVQARCAVGS